VERATLVPKSLLPSPPPPPATHASAAVRRLPRRRRGLILAFRRRVAGAPRSIATSTDHGWYGLNPEAPPSPFSHSASPSPSPLCSAANASLLSYGCDGGAGRLRAGAGDGGGGAAGHPHGRHQGFVLSAFVPPVFSSLLPPSFCFWGLVLWMRISCAEFNRCRVVCWC
jgi:hypothetical protein